MLFFISGIASSLALGKRTKIEYFKERSIRILLPFISGVFLLVPIQIYIEKRDEYSSLWKLYPDFINGIYPEGNFSLHHLWFLLYLYLIALILIPFIDIFRSGRFMSIKDRFVSICNKKYGLNLILIPLLITELILRQYYPEKGAHMLIDDWAYFFYYLFYFFMGYIVFSNQVIVQKVVNNRVAYLTKTLVLLTLLFINKYFLFEENISIIIKSSIEIVFTWTCIMMLFGYAKKYMNKDHKYRKKLNEGIYPFYLLQQPAIVIVGYFVLEWQISLVLKITFLVIISLVFILSLYSIFIIRFKVLRIMFGLKYTRKSNIVNKNQKQFNIF